MYIQKYKMLIKEGLNMPWAGWNEVLSAISKPLYAIRFACAGIKYSLSWNVYGMPIIQKYRGSQIELGKGVWLRSWRSSNPLSPNNPIILATRNASAKIQIGNYVGLTGTTIVSASHISIGDRTLIGANCTLVDTDFHPLDPIQRRDYPMDGRTSPIVIEEDVFIGMNCIILKGVRIGSGSVIGAGSVVTKDVPANSIAAGNPAVVIRHDI